MDYIQKQLYYIAPLPLDEYKEYGFNIQIFNGETGAKTNFLRITPGQLHRIEAILTEGANYE